MNLGPRALLLAARNSMADPRAAARWIIGLDLPLQVAMTAVALMAVVSTILTYVSFALMPTEMQAKFAPLMANPFGIAVVQMVASVAAVFAVHRIGRWRGGHGTLPQAAALLAWMQFVLLPLQVVQIVAEVALPPLGPIMYYAVVAAIFWLLVHFVMELHGFRSAAATFLGILGAMMVISFAIVLLVGPVLPPPAGG